jgi:hypothetical protein
MERTALACELKRARGSIEFSVAAPEADAEIRRLLRENPMRGAVSLSLEREPNYFAGCSLGSARDTTIVARKCGKVVCVGNCSVRMRFINGEAMPVGYLGGLRLDGSVAGRFDILRQGYRFFEEIAREDGASFYFTSIAADNTPARQFLERNLPGMPRYEFIGEFVTLVIPTRQRRTSRDFAQAEPSERFINERQKCFNLAANWQTEEFKELAHAGFRSSMHVSDGSRVAAAGVVWDQRAFKQTVVRGYSPVLRAVRPIVNACAKFRGVRFPPVGETLSLAFLSPMTATVNSIATLVAAAAEIAQRDGIELLALGLDACDPRLAQITNTFRAREYRSRLYAVHWNDRPAVKLDNKLLMPEIALL